MLKPNSDRTDINTVLSNFCLTYNLKYPKETLTEKQFDLLHEFCTYLVPVETNKNGIQRCHT